MPGQSYSEVFSRLSAAAVADAMVRLQIPIRLAPATGASAISSRSRRRCTGWRVASSGVCVAMSRSFGASGFPSSAMAPARPVFAVSTAGTLMRCRPRTSGTISSAETTWPVGDVDGVLFVPRQQIDAVLEEAVLITERERLQARKVQGGIPLWHQFQFEDYQRTRSSDSSYTFRQHLRAVGGAVEE